MKPDGRPAFGGYVRKETREPVVSYDDLPVMGMSLRDYFAAAALQRLPLSPISTVLDPTSGAAQVAAAAAYVIADAMLAEREKP